MWQAVWSWIKTHPQRTAGIFQVASGSLLSSLPTLDLSPKVLAILIALFGLVQAIFGFLHSQEPGS